jgi:hypothetical protein
MRARNDSSANHAGSIQRRDAENHDHATPRRHDVSDDAQHRGPTQNGGSTGGTQSTAGPGCLHQSTSTLLLCCAAGAEVDARGPLIS